MNDLLHATQTRGMVAVGGSMENGIGFGCALAIVISYTAHHSILWAIVHGVFSWLYVIYFALNQ